MSRIARNPVFDTNCAVQPQKMPRGLNFGFRNLCRENKGADQLRNYRASDLHLCFHICKKGGSLMTQLMAYTHISRRLQRLLVGRAIILYSQRTIKVLIKFSGMICTFIVGISQKRESVILILILFGTYDMYIMVYKSSNYKQWPGIVFWYSQIKILSKPK